MSRTPTAAGQPSTRERGCLAPFLLLILLISGGGIFWAFFYEPIEMYMAARHWKPVPCKVFYPDRERPATADKASVGDRVNLSLRYRYTFDGEKYQAARVWFFKPDADEIPAVEKRYPEGDYTCYVDPQDPKTAILDRSFRPQLLIAAFPLTLALIGLAGLIGHYWPHSVEGFIEAHARQRARAGPDGQVMRRKGRGIVVFLAVAIFAVAYNGVMYFLARMVVQTWSEGLPDCHGLFLTGFALPFIALGIGAAGLAVYLALKLFNPRPTLTLSNAKVSPGASIEITWHFTGRIQRIRRLRIFVEGREEATYTRGAKIRTDREVFSTIELLNTKDVAQIPQGKVSLTMPLAAVPSFRSANNCVCWVVRVHGHVRRWPDVDNELDLNVVPAVEPAAAEAPA